MQKIAGILLITFMSFSYAGYNGLTHAAITNCPNVDLSESVSWDLTKPHWLKVSGQHDGPEGQYTHFQYNRDWTKRDGGWEYTYRSNASCHNHIVRFQWYDWGINTHHHIRTDTGKGFVAHTGYYYNCKAYDGWWNVKLPTDKDIKINAIYLNHHEPNKELKEIKKGIHISHLNTDNKKQIKNLINEEKQKGYQENELNNANFLLNLKSNARKEIMQNNFSAYGDHDTHLKNHYSDIKLAFNFNGIAAINESTVIGYAAIGSYVKNNTQDGWDGIRVFFDGHELGICAYAYNTIYGAQLYSETVEYKVNNKPSLTVIEGNHNNGFTYLVEWFNESNMSTLECSNKKLDKTILDKLIMLANKIDATST
jgi:hypothetical protein